MKKRSKAGFTLVETLVGIVVIGVMSVGSWYAVNTLIQSGSRSGDRNTAVNLLQRSQEEVRRATTTFYDSLSNCQFPGPAFAAGNQPCSLTDSAAKFPGYVRSLSVTNEGGSEEIKKAVITVDWNDLNGNPQTLSSVVLLVRPPDPLPGNIIGTVRSTAAGNALIPGARITAKLVDPVGAERQTVSTGSLSAKGANFDFSDTGKYVLTVGRYELSATHPNYRNKTHPDIIEVLSNTETPVIEIFMEPNPTDAKINFQLRNAAAGNAALVHFYNPLNSGYYAHTKLFDDGATPATSVVPTSSYGSVAKGTFTVKFTNTDPKSFTINNLYAYAAGWSLKHIAVGGVSCPFAYDPQGWSSAIAQEGGTQVCSNPYNGNSASDRITVNPGDDITVDVLLDPVPRATISGQITDETGIPIPNATVLAYWPIATHGGGNWPWIIRATADASGNYSYSVPAVQELFPNINNDANKLRVIATGNVMVKNCCNAENLQSRNSNPVYVGPLFDGTSVSNVNFVITRTTIQCGNARGHIKDALSGGMLVNASVQVGGVGDNTDSSGEYLYECPAEGFKLPAQLSALGAQMINYYDYSTYGNNWYNAAPHVNVRANEMVVYDAKLWPKGYGDLEVTVIDAGSLYPVKGATVTLSTTTGLFPNKVLTTGNDGIALYSNLNETWPPPDLPIGDPYYKRTTLGHNLTVDHISGTYTRATASVPVLQKNSLLKVEIKLFPAGGT